MPTCTYMHASCLSDAVNGFPQTGVVYWRCFQIGALIQRSWYINLCFLVPTFPQGPLPFFYSWFPSPSLWTQTRSLFFLLSASLSVFLSLSLTLTPTYTSPLCPVSKRGTVWAFRRTLKWDMARTSEDPDTLNEAYLIYKWAESVAGGGGGGKCFQRHTRPQGPPLVPWPLLHGTNHCTGEDRSRRIEG